MEKGIKTLVHGDDYFSSCSRASLDWLEKQLSDEYEIKTQRVCGREGCAKEGKILNRSVRWTPQGYELEGDPRHAELAVGQLGMQDLPSLSAPGIDCVEADAGDEDDVELGAVKANLYRGIAARCNDHQPDRPVVALRCQGGWPPHVQPTARALELPKKIGRYLKGKPRLIWKCERQLPMDVIDVHSDASWTGSRRSRKSTSCRTMSIGHHLIRACSKTQAVVANHAGESELYAVVRASTEAIVMVTLLSDFGASRF